MICIFFPSRSIGAGWSSSWRLVGGITHPVLTNVSKPLCARHWTSNCSKWRSSVVHGNRYEWHLVLLVNMTNSVRDFQTPKAKEMFFTTEVLWYKLLIYPFPYYVHGMFSARGSVIVPSLFVVLCVFLCLCVCPCIHWSLCTWVAWG